LRSTNRHYAVASNKETIKQHLVLLHDNLHLLLYYTVSGKKM